MHAHAGAMAYLEVPYLLEKLKAPTPSDLARKRVIAKNPTQASKRSTASVHEEPKVSPATRVQEFPNEHLTVSKSKLFCSACREPLSVKKIIIQRHISSSKHMKGKEKIKAKEKREGDIAEILGSYDKDVHPVSENLPEAVRVYRYKVVSTFMKAGVPLAIL